MGALTVLWAAIALAKAGVSATFSRTNKPKITMTALEEEEEEEEQEEERRRGVRV